MLSSQAKKGINIYISRSMLTDVYTLESIRARLLKVKGVKSVYYYNGNSAYSRSLLTDADLVLSLPREEKSKNKYDVGKGQFDEIEFAISENIPVFRLNRDLTYSIITKHSLNYYNISNNISSWKKGYGTIENSSSQEKIIITNNLVSEQEDLLLICNIK